METNEIKTLEDFKHFASYHFKRLKPAENKYEFHTLDIKVSGYSDIFGLAVNLIKMCIYTAKEGNPEINNVVKDPHIDIVSVLELALQLLPYSEIEVLDEINQLLIDDAQNRNEITTEKE